MEPWQRVDTAPPDEARALLRRCCGSSRWVDAMLAGRPFGSLFALLDAASEIWNGLGETDWLEAFRHHPKIGDRKTGDARFADTRTLSEREQSGVAGASDDIRRELDDANRAYEARFGYIFIVCATGLGAEEMLARLRERLVNDPAEEIRTAASEQEKITALRLRGLK